MGLLGLPLTDCNFTPKIWQCPWPTSFALDFRKKNHHWVRCGECCELYNSRELNYSTRSLKYCASATNESTTTRTCSSNNTSIVQITTNQNSKVRQGEEDERQKRMKNKSRQHLKSRLTLLYRSSGKIPAPKVILAMQEWSRRSILHLANYMSQHQK